MTNKPKIRSGIVGSGFAANLHYEGIERVYGAEVDLVGIFSPTETHARHFAEPRGLTTFASLDALLDDVEVVHICASPAAHEAVSVAALKRGVHAVVEKPLTGWFGDGNADFDASGASMQRARDGALASVDRMLEAEAKSKAMILYAENWVYAPAIQKEREIIEKTGAQVLWMHGEESHSGSHSKAYGFWRLNGGGALPAGRGTATGLWWPTTCSPECSVTAGTSPPGSAGKRWSGRVTSARSASSIFLTLTSWFQGHS